VEPVGIEPGVSPDGQTLVFVLSLSGRDIECVVMREALEQHFWVSPGASETRMLKAFVDGRARIVAVAERKARARAGERIVLTVDDFGGRG